MHTHVRLIILPSARPRLSLSLRLFLGFYELILGQ